MGAIPRIRRNCGDELRYVGHDASRFAKDDSNIVKHFKTLDDCAMVGALSHVREKTDLM